MNKYGQEVFCTTEDRARWKEEQNITQQEARTLEVFNCISGTDTSSQTGELSYQNAGKKKSKHGRHHRQQLYLRDDNESGY